MTAVGKKVYLYGLDEDYRVVRYSKVAKEYPAFQDIKVCAYHMHNEVLCARYIFAANSSYRVYRACVDSIVNKTFEDRVLFKLLLEAEGVQMY